MIKKQLYCHKLGSDWKLAAPDIIKYAPKLRKLESITMAELILENVSKRFGGLLAVNQLNMEVPEGKILSLIGPNGAGKTTVFNMITGVYPPTEGTIAYQGERLNNLKSSRIISHGIARTFQNIRLFKSMTVLENVQVGMHCRTRSGPVRALL